MFLLAIGKAYGWWKTNSTYVLYRCWVRAPSSSKEASLTGIQSITIIPLHPVIPDTLSAAMTSQTLSKEEGEPLELTCESSKATAQHTHLSVTWYLMQDGERSQASKIISLSKDFVLLPGPLYTERFAAGDVRLDKLGVTTFRLSIGRLRPSDQGQLFCEATEWIQDPDETWTSITKKQTDQTTLRVQPAGNYLLRKFINS